MATTDKARKLIYIWSSTFERLKAISDTTRKPMTELFDEAVSLLAVRYPVQDPAVKERL